MPYSPWIKVARTPGGGGGSGSNKAAPSLSGSMKQVQLGDSPAASPPENKDLGYAWSQTDDEVELKFKCESGVKGKDVQIKFGRTTLKVEISGKTLADGAMGGVIVVDESTYTLQDEGKGRELCIVLTKAEEGRLWPHAVQN